jgi:E1-E2 ATPase
MSGFCAFGDAGPDCIVEYLLCARPSARRQKCPFRRWAAVGDPGQLWRALPEALRKLDPVTLIRNPVMFVTEVGAALTTGLTLAHCSLFGRLITVWLWLTVVFANLAEAVAESRGRAQADTLRRTRQQTTARRLTGWTEGAAQSTCRQETVSAAVLQRGDHTIVDAGELIPGDDDVVQGVASVDESAITGESAPVIRESGGDRCAVTGGRHRRPADHCRRADRLLGTDQTALRRRGRFLQRRQRPPVRGSEFLDHVDRAAGGPGVDGQRRRARLHRAWHCSTSCRRSPSARWPTGCTDGAAVRFDLL